MIEPDSPRHVILYAFVRKFAHHKRTIDDDRIAQIVNLDALLEEGPIRQYGRRGVYGHLNYLHKKGHIRAAMFHGQKVGYVLGRGGLDALDELGVPTQYDH